MPGALLPKGRRCWLCRKPLDDLGTVVNVDPKRIFAMGMSNGAMMCYRLAAEMSERIAAIAAGGRDDGDRPLSAAHAGLGLALPRHQRRTGALWRAERPRTPKGHLVPFRRRDDPDLGLALMAARKLRWLKTCMIWRTMG